MSLTPTCWPRGLLRRGRLLERRGIMYAVHGRLCAAAAGVAARHTRTHDVDVAFQAPGRRRELWGGGGDGGGEDVCMFVLFICLWRVSVSEFKADVYTCLMYVQ